MDKKYLIDTNVIIKYPSVFTAFKNTAVHLRSIEELDYLKESTNPDLAYRARKGAKNVEHYLPNITVEKKRYGAKTVDDTLLKCARRNKYILITNDLTLSLKCKFSGVQSMGYKNGEQSFYTGIKIVFVDDDSEIEGIVKRLDGKLCKNEFLIIKNKTLPFTKHDGTEDFISTKQFVQKETLIEVKDKYITNMFNKKIVSRNPEQRCLIWSLFDENISIVCVGGGYGTGKSFLTTNYAFQQLERGRISKIVYVPNNSFTANSREIGALPGSLLEKEIMFMGTLADIVGADEIERRVNEGTLELMPISLARGRNLEDSIVLVSESQNLTEEHIKLLIGRLGEGSRIFFDGDLRQTDRPIFKNSNGLKLLYKIRNSKFADLFSSVKLENIERSRTAQVSDYLESVE